MQAVSDERYLAAYFKRRVRRSSVDAWANFLASQRLEASLVREEHLMDLVRLAEHLGHDGYPRIASHDEVLRSRVLVCRAAMEVGLDLTAIKNRRGKTAIGRGLLDAWNRIYAERYGSNVGTAGSLEAKRRDVRTRVSRQQDVFAQHSREPRQTPTPEAGHGGVVIGSPEWHEAVRKLEGKRRGE